MARYFALFGIILSLFALGSGAASAAPAQPPALAMTVTPYLGGHVKYGEWLPLRINLSNDGNDLEAEIRTQIASSSGQSVYATAVSLPSGARKQVDLYVLPTNFSQEISVQLVKGEQVLAKAKTQLSPHPQSEYLVGVVAANPDAFGILRSMFLMGRTQTQLVSLSLDDLAERLQAWRSLDCLILADVDTTTLTSAQRESLRAWVESGGRLLLGGGAGAQRTLAGLSESLQLVRLGEPIEWQQLDSLADFAGAPIKVPGPFLAVPPAEHQGWLVIEQDQQPLLVQKSLGEGWIAYLAIDPSQSPFDAWAGALNFWQRLLEPGAAMPDYLPHDIPARVLESEQMSHALSNLPALDLPSVRNLALLLGVYIVLVGPFNYVLLRRLRRFEWAWVTIPLLTLAFSIGSYGLGYRLRGSDVIINQISIIPLSPDSQHLAVRSYVGLFSPSQTSYNVQVAGGALISSLSYDSGSWGGPPSQGNLDVLQGEPAVVRGLGVNQWAMRTFQAETWLDAADLTTREGPVGIDATLVVKDDQVRGTIHNNLGRPLQDMVLLSGHRYARLGDLDVDEERELEAALEGNDMGASFPWALFEHHFMANTPPSRQVKMRQSILEAYFHTNWGPSPAPPEYLTILAWTDFSPFDVQIPGVRPTHEQTTLVIASLPLPTIDGQVSLPAGFLQGNLIETSGEARGCGPSGQIYVGQGRAVLEYQLPSSLQGINPTALSIRRGPKNIFGELPIVSLYDWALADWVSLTDLESGQDYKVPDPLRFVNPASGSIRLQAEKNNFGGGGGCYQFDVGLQGQLPPEKWSRGGSAND